ncbi:MAG TPA: fused MFS/spermidine synthase [Thermoanaerobaculia bacterium]|nr:fused MFS/spermidine synthase [Thermoanaerobaculia bacterium]
MIRTFVFVSGAILMALEMVASRFLAPQYGNSIIVWASLISVFLAGLSIGYWLGGAFADRLPSMNGVAAVLLTAGGFVLLIPLAAPLVFAVAPADVRSGSLTAAVLLFLAPTVLMGSVSPYAIRLDAADRERLGRSAGVLYAISTCGSIFGTIATAFWLIPFAGIDNLTYMLGAALVGLATVVAVYAGARQRVMRIAIAAGASTALLIGAVVMASDSTAWQKWRRPQTSDTKLVYVHDSFYHHIAVTDAAGTRSLKFDDYVQSAVSLLDPLEARTDYTDHLHLGVALAHPHDVLMIGLGGGTLVKQFLRDYPGVRIDVAEIDPDVVGVAGRFFAVPIHDPRTNIAVEDGRRFLEHTPRKYDLIVLDAFNRHSVPFHLVTREFFELCRSKLQPGGYIEMNFIARPGGDANEALASVFETLGTAFSERYAFARDPKSRQQRNWILIGGNGPQMGDAQLFATIAAASDVRPRYRQLAAHLISAGPDRARAKILTDQYAPIEEMMR